MAEQRQLISWQDPPAWSAAASNDAPPGRGNFMIKIGGRPGIPFRVTLTKAEERLHDTNKLWHEQSRRGELGPTTTRRVRRSSGALTGCVRQTDTQPAPGRSRRCSRARSRSSRSPPPRGRPPRRPARRSTTGATAPPLDPLALVARSSPTAELAGRPRRRRLLIGAAVRVPADRDDRGCAARSGGRRAAPIGRRGCWVPAAASIRSHLRTRGQRPSGSASQQPGLPIARAVAGGQTLYATWEDMQCDIWGPRKGKSSSRAIPTVLAAPGAAFATSNKPDLYAATRAVREQHGRIWNFDPEAIAAGEPDWWWNPLSYVTSDRRALELTDAFVGAYRDPDARPDPFFDPAGQELVSHLLRAAARRRAADHTGVSVVNAPQRRRARPDPAGPRPRAGRRVGARPRPRTV